MEAPRRTTPGVGPVDDRVVLLVDFDDVDTGLQQVSKRDDLGDVVARSALAVDNALVAIRDVAVRAVENVVGMARPPNEIELTFGVKLNSDASVVIARAGAEAAFQVRLSWSRADLIGSDEPDL